MHGNNSPNYSHILRFKATGVGAALMALGSLAVMYESSLDSKQKNRFSGL